MLYKRKELVDFVEKSISNAFDKDEIKTISKYFIADLYGSFIEKKIDQKEWARFSMLVEKLSLGVPLQYVTNKSYFLNTILYVDQRVLIPRPETEDLVIKACNLIEEYKLENILDIGTGSGCISIEIKKRLPHVNITAIDVSLEALEVAKLNILNERLDINTSQIDILDKKQWDRLPVIDLIVSNPPYISAEEAMEMKDIVLGHEPHLALFSKNDPETFYQSISELAIKKKIEHVICEMNASRYKQINDCFNSGIWKVQLYDDLQGKPRIIEAIAKK